jgi:long-chain acyl-CoA synthetase
MGKNNLIDLFIESFKQNRGLPAFSDYQGKTMTYGEAAQVIRQMHHFFNTSGIEKGDKIALFGRNSSNWAISFLAILSYGAVVVPVLPDFNPEDVHHILNHSESKFLFVADQLFDKLTLDKIPDIRSVVSLTNFDALHFSDEKQKTAWLSIMKGATLPDPDDPKMADLSPEDLCIISYTSGTSGFTKGVMIPVRSLYSNIIFAQEHMPLKPGNRIVSFLPMAHVFGLLFEFLFPASVGCHITFLTKAPTPQIITKAFEEVKPHLILSVPLVIEKIYKKKIQPTLEKPLIRVLLKIPGISGLLHRQIRQKLIETFGGNFFELVIGGAALNPEVESFFRKIKFPFTIGYGMTECGPLISYDSWKTTRPSSAGRLVDRMELKIDSDDPSRQVGEIMVRGANVMLGYFKNPEATREVLGPDGWLRTGDLGITNPESYIFIRGRSKNMLLGPSGQNIYPEEIEAKLNNLPYISECVVVEREKKLVALVFPDKESQSSEHIGDEQLINLMEDNRVLVNRELPRYAQISKIQLVETEFEKTPKKNIKRYLYT